MFTLPLVGGPVVAITPSVIFPGAPGGNDSQKACKRGCYEVEKESSKQVSLLKTKFCVALSIPGTNMIIKGDYSLDR